MFLFWAKKLTSFEPKKEVKTESKIDLKQEEKKTVADQKTNTKIDKKINQKYIPKKAYNVEEIRKTDPNAYKRWTIKEENQLKDLFHLGHTIKEISKIMGRDKDAIISRLHKIELRK